MSQATTLARSIVHQLIELGVQDFVLSPGSRNAPLSIALYQAEKKGLINLHVRIDERGAAFFALGISKATGKYVPVICTSGTAVANYLPAVLEAFHSDVNLLLLTADRPERLRRTGSNQTTLQAGIFGEFVHSSIDTSSPIDLTHHLDHTGPVHINLQFDEPLLESDNSDWLAGINPKKLSKTSHPKGTFDCTTRKNVVIVGHDRAGIDVREIEEFAAAIGAPILGEDPLVFERSVSHAPIILSDERARNALAPELVVVIGRTTLSRSVNAYVSGAAHVMVIDPRMEKIDRARTATEKHFQIPRLAKKRERDESWFELWAKYESLASQAVSELPEWSEGRALATIASEIQQDTALFISSSRPIRDLESFAQPRGGVVTYANRGLAGIDGNISTAMGIATFHEETYAVIGDLAFLHDLSALAQPTQDPLTLIVIDNDGGGIFSTLPQRGVEGFEKIFGTPHGQDLAKLVGGFGISHESVASVRELQIAMRRVHPGLHVIIATMPDREANADAIGKVLTKYRELVAL